MNIKLEVYHKNNGNYKLVNTLVITSERCITDLLYYNERKLDGERGLRINKHYNYSSEMTIDIYFNNNYKYVYYNVPCTAGAHVDGVKLLEMDRVKEEKDGE